MNGRRIVSGIIFLAALACAGTSAWAQIQMQDYTSLPAFVTTSNAPNVMLLLSNDQTGFWRGYGGLTDYNNALIYYGYFDPNQCYKYDSTNKYFYTQDSWLAFNHYTMNPATGREADGSILPGDKDMWSGNFLNWLTMTHVDFMRKTMTGGRVNGGDGTTWWLLERGDIADDCGGSTSECWTKTYCPVGTTNPDIGALTPFAAYVPGTYTAEYPTSSNQVLYFDFEAANWTGTTIKDTALNPGAQNGTAMPATGGASRSTTTKFAGASSLYLDGSNDWVDIPAASEISALGGNLTVEFWMYRTDSSKDMWIIGNHDNPNKTGYGVVGLNGGAVSFQLWNTSYPNGGRVDSVSKPSNNAWHYIVCTYDKSVDTDGDGTANAGVMYIYIDGCLDAYSSVQFSGDMGTSAVDTGIGYTAQAPYNAKYFKGYLDEVSVWKQTFSTNMVRSRYEHTWGTRTVPCLTVAGGGTYNFKNRRTTMRVTKSDGTDVTGWAFDLYVKIKVTEKPHGLVQDFGTSVRFGLMTYSYDGGMAIMGQEQGGVLRANCSQPGDYYDQTGDLISFINNFTEKGWDPAGEMFWEATRYFRNSSSYPYTPNPAFFGSTTNTTETAQDRDGHNVTFPIKAWIDPMRVYDATGTDKGLNQCRKNFIILMTDEYPSRDLDYMPGAWRPTVVTSSLPSGAPALPGAESKAELAAANYLGVTAPTGAPAGGLNTEWWTNKVGDLELINGHAWNVGCVDNTCTCPCCDFYNFCPCDPQWGDPLWDCSQCFGCNGAVNCTTPKTVTQLGHAYGQCPNEAWAVQGAAFNLAGAAYWAHVSHLRPDVVTNAAVAADPTKRISIETFTIAMRTSPYGYQPPPPPMNVLWLAAKYGGFQDMNGTNTPDLQDEWDAGGDGVPDNFMYAEKGDQIFNSLSRAIMTILARSASGTAASILSASRSGQGALYQAMFYPGRVDVKGNSVSWSGQLDAFWVDQYGALREETPSDPSEPGALPASITQPFSGTTISSFTDIKRLNLYWDKVVRLYFDSTNGRTRAMRYAVDKLGRIVTGTATTSIANQLWDTRTNFLTAGVTAGMRVEQIKLDTNGNMIIPAPIATITAVSANMITAAGITWTVGDQYVVSQGGPDATVEVDGLNPMWDAGRWLAEHGAKDRRIFAWVDRYDTGTLGVVDGTATLFGGHTSADEVQELAGTGSQTVAIGTGKWATTMTETNLVQGTDTLASTLMRYLRAGSAAEAAQIINYIRGVDQPAALYRKRTFLVPNDDTNPNAFFRTLKLGDIVHSTPAVAGIPNEDYDLIYKDSSYTAFYRKYGDRRNVVYAGGNDGMLHAFNAGFYDRSTGVYYDNTYKLGQELWAFIPHQLLPHLVFLTDPNYTHVYYVDLKPRIFDARIYDPSLGTSDAHPGGWATLLLCGMGMGGRDMKVDIQNNGTAGDQPGELFRSAYFLLDVTNPLNPILLGTYTDTSSTAALNAGLGLTTSYPAIFRIQDKWFVLVGSGPNGTNLYKGQSVQKGLVYILQITSSGLRYVNKFFIPDTEATAFMGDPAAADLDLATGTTTSGGTTVVTWSGEAGYIGSIFDKNANPSSPLWRGRMYHLKMPTTVSSTPAASDFPASIITRLAPTSTDTVEMGPVSAAANVAKDGLGRYWVYFGTGRYLDPTDTSDTTVQKFYGLKEPVSSGTLTFGQDSLASDTNPTSTTSLYDATSAKVYNGGAVDYNGDGTIDYATFNAFLTALNSNASKNGWVIQSTATAERFLGMPTVIGGITLFTSYVPPTGGGCSYGGSSYLYAPYFQTGTAYQKSVVGLGTDTYAGNQSVLRKTGLGTGVATSPTAHVGDKSKSFIQSSTGAIIDMETTTAFPVKSGVRSWRMD